MNYKTTCAFCMTDQVVITRVGNRFRKHRDGKRKCRGSYRTPGEAAKLSGLLVSK